MIKLSLTALVLVAIQGGVALAGESNNLASVEIPATSGVYNTTQWPRNSSSLETVVRQAAQASPGKSVEVTMTSRQASAQ